jgi:predicted ATPase
MLEAGEAMDRAIAEMQRGLAAKRATGAELKVPYYLGLLAHAHRQADRAAEALPLLAEAVARVERTGERWFEAEVHRLRAEALLAASPDRRSAAEALLRQALIVAEQQGAKLWELRAATSLARLWRDQGKRLDAHNLLAPIYGWFTAGFDTPDLKNAKALLEQLGEPN